MVYSETKLEPPTRLRVLIVRHGETRENVERIIQGQLDTDLNERGRTQADTTGRFLATTRIDRIIASPLKRAADTARAILKHQSSGSLQLEFDDRLKERAFGVLEGKVYNGGAKKPEDTEGIERMEPFSERLASFWNDLVTRAAVPDSDPAERTETVVLVSHGAAISALMNQVLTPGRYCLVPPSVVPSRFWNCSITELAVPVIRTSPASIASTSAGSASRRADWSFRPIHLGVQGAQFILDHEVQKKLLGTMRERALQDRAAQDTLRELEAHVAKTAAEFERDPQGQLQLAADVIRAPDGTAVQADIGYGPAIGTVVQWSNIDHLQHLDEPAANAEKTSKPNNINVDELVK